MKDKLNILIQTLKNTPKIISDYILLIPENSLNIKRGEKFWTIKKHLIHLDHVQNILFDRLLKLKNEEKPKISPYYPDDNENEKNKFETINDVLNSYKNKRNKQIELINELKDSDLKKEASHDEYIKYNLEIILNHILFHDYWHMYRIEELWLIKDKYLSK